MLLFSFQHISGTPYRQLSIHCWSLFRDQDFHTRFHYDHLEYSGQWHGQYRGYKHGRVHSVSSDHEHAIGVAEALEICMACSWIASVSEYQEKRNDLRVKMKYFLSYYHFFSI